MIRAAKISDIEGINKLLSFYGLGLIDESWLLDVAFVSEMNSEIVGFVWAGLMNGGTLAYIDYLTVAPIAKGDAFRLAKTTLQELDRRRVKTAVSLVARDGTAHSAEAYRVNEKIGMHPISEKFFFFKGDVSKEAEKWVQ